jgi:DNA-binding response OmpR family regulator
MYAMRILVLDDERTVSSAIRLSLQKKGHTVIEAHNPIEALDQIEKDKDKVELLVLDYNLYLLSGFDFLKLFRTTNSNTPVVMITSNKIDSINDNQFLKQNTRKIISKDKPINEIVNDIEIALNKDNLNKKEAS